MTQCHPSALWCLQQQHLSALPTPAIWFDHHRFCRHLNLTLGLPVERRRDRLPTARLVLSPPRACKGKRSCPTHENVQYSILLRRERERSERRPAHTSRRARATRFGVTTSLLCMRGSELQTFCAPSYMPEIRTWFEAVVGPPLANPARIPPTTKTRTRRVRASRGRSPPAPR